MSFLKPILILSFIFLFKTQGDSQNWEKWYGSENIDLTSESILEDYDNGILIAGNLLDFDNLMVFPKIIKITINGDTIWSKLMISSDYVGIRKVKKTIDGYTLICGEIRINDKPEPFVAKLNACGEKEWCTVFRTYFELPWAQDIAETSTGEIGVIVNQFDEGSKSYLFKLNSDGNLIWKRPYCDIEQYPYSRQPLAESLNIFNDEFLITGNVYWKNPDDDIYPIRPLFTMYDTDGYEKFVLPFGVDDGIIGDANASIQIESDRFIGVGSFWSDKKDALIMEFDNQGNELNYKIFNSSEIHPSFNSSVLMSAQKIDDKYFFMSYAGVEESGNPVTEFSTTCDLFGSGFEVIDLLQHPNSRSPISEMIKTHDNKLLCAMTDDAESEYRIYLTKINTNLEQDSVYTEPYEYDYLCDHPIESGTIYLDDCNVIVGTDEIPSPKGHLEQKVYIQITPNPAKDKVSFRIENTLNFQELDLHITSVFGQQVYKTTLINGQTELTIPLSNWYKGVYLIQVFSNRKMVGSNRFVKI